MSPRRFRQALSYVKLKLDDDLQINQKKKLSMTCYTNALNSLSGDGDEELDGPAARRVQKCLQKLLRALHKDRHHTIQHYRHILDTSLEQVV